jgi:formylglycine-generating enzyme required for sulfatase activity
MGTSKEDAERDLKEVPVGERTATIPYLIEGAEHYMKQEMPQHPVHISRPFGLGKFPVTYAEFAAFLEDTGYKTDIDCGISVGRSFRRARGSWADPGFTPTDRAPIVCVNSHDTAVYIAWLNTKVQNSASAKGSAPYRLPSEAEWEYAARAGTQTAYWWGNLIGSNNSVCHTCGSRWDFKQPAPVGSFPPNQFGLYDMLGNIMEKTADCWNPTYSGAPSDGSAWRAGDCEKQVDRGGSWDSDFWSLRAADRGSLPLDLRANNTGFRIVRELQ